MANKHSFKYRNRTVGRPGELLVAGYLWSRPETLYLKDVSRVGKYKLEQIDYFWSKRGLDGVVNKLSLEVKTTKRSLKNGSFAIQTSGNRRTGLDGTLFRTKADFFCYVSLVDDSLYMIDTKVLQGWFEEARSRFKPDYRPTTNQKGEISRFSEVYYVPGQLLLQEVPCIIVDDLSKNQASWLIKIKKRLRVLLKPHQRIR